MPRLGSPDKARIESPIFYLKMTGLRAKLHYGKSHQLLYLENHS